MKMNKYLYILQIYILIYLTMRFLMVTTWCSWWNLSPPISPREISWSPCDAHGEICHCCTFMISSWAMSTVSVSSERSDSVADLFISGCILSITLGNECITIFFWIRNTTDLVYRIGCSLPLSPISPGSSRNPWPHNKSLASVCPGTSSLVRRALSRYETSLQIKYSVKCVPGVR